MTEIGAHVRWDVYEGEVIRARFPHFWWSPRRHFINWLERRRYGYPRYIGRILNEPPVLTFEGHNLVDTSGKGLLLDRLFGVAGAGAALTQAVVGANNTTAAIGDTDATFTTPVRVTFDSTPTRAGLVVTSVATYGTGVGNIVWAECGQENAVPTLFDRIAPIGPFTKTTAVSIVLTFTTTQS